MMKVISKGVTKINYFDNYTWNDHDSSKFGSLVKQLWIRRYNWFLMISLFPKMITVRTYSLK